MKGGRVANRPGHLPAAISSQSGWQYLAQVARHRISFTPMGFLTRPRREPGGQANWANWANWARGPRWLDSVWLKDPLAVAKGFLLRLSADWYHIKTGRQTHGSQWPYNLGGGSGLESKIARVDCRLASSLASSHHIQIPTR